MQNHRAHMQAADQGQVMEPNLGMVTPDYSAIQRGSGECSAVQLAADRRTTPPGDMKARSVLKRWEARWNAYLERRTALGSTL